MTYIFIKEYFGIILWYFLCYLSSDDWAFPNVHETNKKNNLKSFKTIIVKYYHISNNNHLYFKFSKQKYEITSNIFNNFLWWNHFPFIIEIVIGIDKHLSFLNKMPGKLVPFCIWWYKWLHRVSNLGRPATYAGSVITTPASQVS